MSTPQTDTPETDAAAFEVKEHGSPLSIEVTMASFAKTLERRAIAAEARVKELESMVITHIKGDEWQAQAKQLAEARAARRLRPIAEGGPVPEGMIRLYAQFRDRWNASGWNLTTSTHFIDIYPPQQ